MSQAELAERLGVTRQTIVTIERGNPKVAIGTIFEAARILGIPLFADNEKIVNQWQMVLQGFLALMPTRVRAKKIKIDDNF